MSKAYYFVRNFTLPQVLNLMCYSTKYPHTLTSTQKITRLYRYFTDQISALIRRQYAISLQENRADPQVFHQSITTYQQDFKRLLNISEDSPQFKLTIQKYEKWIHKNIDPTMLVNESRPYAANSSKYYVYNDDQLSFDPYGYYKQKSIAGRNPGYGFIYYPDFPHDNNHWVMQKPPGKDTGEQDKASFASSV